MPDKEFDLLESILLNILKRQKQSIPKGKLGLKSDFDTSGLYEKLLIGRFLG